MLSEQVFLETIDCNFPYNEREQSIAIINEAFWISENAVFSVMYELLFVPYGVSVTKDTVTEYIQYIKMKDISFSKRFEDFFHIFLVFLESGFIPEVIVVPLLKRVKEFNNLYVLIAILVLLINEPTDTIYDIYFV